jgi:hypothetical protein
MKTFGQFLREMALNAYRTSFVPVKDEEEEGYGKLPGGGKNLGLQVVHPGTRDEVEISGLFSKKDKVVLSHPKTFRTLEQRLSNSKYQFNILLMESMFVMFGNYKNEAEKFIKEQGIQTQGYITFIKNGTSGHLMTPWMILHTIGHAATTFTEISMEGQVKDAMIGISAYILEKEGKTDEIKNLYGPFLGWRTMLKEFLMFQSAKDITNGGIVPAELVNELVAEFLWHGGKIRIAPKYRDDPFVNHKIDSIRARIEEMLDLCVGQVIYDHYG